MHALYQPFSSLSHLLGGVFAVFACLILLKKGAGNRLRVASLLVFSISLILLLLASGTYHAFEPGIGKQIFRRLDYACIYLLIAGTGTPIHIILFRGWWRWGMLTFIWTFAVLGLIFTVSALDFLPDYVPLTLFLMLGWSALISIFKAIRIFGFSSVQWAIWGGLFYTIGALFEVLSTPIFLPYLSNHDFFHLMVLLGAGSHWFFIYKWSDQPTCQKLIFMVKEIPNIGFLAKARGEDISISASSKNELRQQISALLKKRFHPAITPQRIRFRFYIDKSINI
jgi:channel protein (hemolysin III family)